jgi:hypothetical protein
LEQCCYLLSSVLSTLLYEWLEHLRNPILDTDSITYIVILADNTEKAFKRLPVSVAYTLEYTIRFVTRLQPLHRDKVSQTSSQLYCKKVDKNDIFDPCFLPVELNPNPYSKQQCDKSL